MDWCGFERVRRAYFDLHEQTRRAWPAAQGKGGVAAVSFELWDAGSGSLVSGALSLRQTQPRVVRAGRAVWRLLGRRCRRSGLSGRLGVLVRLAVQ